MKKGPSQLTTSLPYSVMIIHSCVPRDYSNPELRHHHVLFINFIYIDVFMFTSAKVHSFILKYKYFTSYFYNPKGKH